MQSFVFTSPDVLASASHDLAAIESAIRGANFVAAPSTTSMLAAAEDEVSAAISLLFSSHAQQYQVLSAQAEAFHGEFVGLLSGGALQYASTEIASAERLLVTTVNTSAQVAPVGTGPSSAAVDVKGFWDQVQTVIHPVTATIDKAKEAILSTVGFRQSSTLSVGSDENGGLTGTAAISMSEDPTHTAFPVLSQYLPNAVPTVQLSASGQLGYNPASGFNSNSSINAFAVKNTPLGPLMLDIVKDPNSSQVNWGFDLFKWQSSGTFSLPFGSASTGGTGGTTSADSIVGTWKEVAYVATGSFGDMPVNSINYQYGTQFDISKTGSVYTFPGMGTLTPTQPQYYSGTFDAAMNQAIQSLVQTQYQNPSISNVVFSMPWGATLSSDGKVMNFYENLTWTWVQTIPDIPPYTVNQGGTEQITITLDKVSN